MVDQQNKRFTLLQDRAVCVHGLVDDGLPVGRLGHLLALHADLLALCDHMGMLALAGR